MIFGESQHALKCTRDKIGMHGTLSSFNVLLLSRSTKCCALRLNSSLLNCFKTCLFSLPPVALDRANQSICVMAARRKPTGLRVAGTCS